MDLNISNFSVNILRIMIF